MSLNRKVINPVPGGASLPRTIKANYFKMGVHNFLFTKRDRQKATGVIYEFK